MLKNSFLVISLLLPLTALSATAQAGWPEAQTAAARSNPQHYWPSEARPAVHSGTGTVQSGPRDAFASSMTAPLQAPTNVDSSANAWRYHGGPKSSW